MSSGGKVHPSCPEPSSPCCEEREQVTWVETRTGDTFKPSKWQHSGTPAGFQPVLCPRGRERADLQHVPILLEGRAELWQLAGARPCQAVPGTRREQSTKEKEQTGLVPGSESVTVFIQQDRTVALKSHHHDHQSQILPNQTLSASLGPGLWAGSSRGCRRAGGLGSVHRPEDSPPVPCESRVGRGPPETSWKGVCGGCTDLWGSFRSRMTPFTPNLPPTSSYSQGFKSW